MKAPRAPIPGEIVLLAGLGAFVGLAALAQRALHAGPFGLGAALLFAAVPAILWMAYFHLQDRLEPEPIGLLLGVFLLGAMVAYPLSRFLSGAVSGAPGWHEAGSFSARNLCASILVVGVAQELAQYLTVRYSVYRLAEFDEPIDGIVYAAACGIGFATAENLSYLRGLAHAHLAIVAVNVVVCTLGQACFAAVLGFALATARFATATAAARSARLGAGLIAAAVLNGTFHLVQQRLATDGLRAAPLRLLLPATLATLVILVTTTRLLVRINLATSVHRPEGTP